MEKQFEREKRKQYYKSFMEKVLKEKLLKIYYIPIKAK